MVTLRTLSSKILRFHSNTSNPHHTIIPTIHTSTQMPTLNRSTTTNTTNNLTTPHRKQHPCSGSTSYLLRLHRHRFYLPPRSIQTRTQQLQTILRASSVDGHSEHRAIGLSSKSRWPLRGRFPLLERYASARVSVRRRGVRRERISGWLSVLVRLLMEVQMGVVWQVRLGRLSLMVVQRLCQMNLLRSSLPDGIRRTEGILCAMGHVDRGYRWNTGMKNSFSNYSSCP
jgi:hypothetical protein